jgi:hypothetical protein
MLGPILTFTSFVWGLVAWRLQLLDKRRFEVTEKVMVVYTKVAQAISVLRILHSCYCFGKTPIQTFLDASPFAHERDSSSVSTLSPRQPTDRHLKRQLGQAARSSSMAFHSDPRETRRTGRRRYRRRSFADQGRTHGVVAAQVGDVRGTGRYRQGVESNYHWHVRGRTEAKGQECGIGDRT